MISSGVDYPFSCQYNNVVDMWLYDKPVKINCDDSFCYYYWCGLWYNYVSLRDLFGIFKTKSIVDYAVYGEVKSWYNPDSKLYYDSVKKCCSTESPNFNEIVPCYVVVDEPQEDMYSVDEPILLGSGLKKFVERTEVKDWVQGYTLEMADFDDDLLECYIDVLKLDQILYVADPNGVDFGGDHYDYGDVITGVEIQEVWVDAGGVETFYFGSVKYNLPWLEDSLTSGLKHYWLEYDFRYYTEAELLAKGYTRTVSVDCWFADNNSSINNIYLGSYNASYGYFVDGDWYVDVSALNTAGFYELDHERKTVYRSSGSIHYDWGLTNASTTFYHDGNKSLYRAALWTNSTKTTPFVCDDKIWFFNLVESGITQTNVFIKLEDMPSTTSSVYNKFDILTCIVSENGDPINLINQSDIGSQLYFYVGSNYYSSGFTTGDNAFLNIVIDGYKYKTYE